MPYSTLLIDLDETVYSPACGVWEAISHRMENYMHEFLHLEKAEIPQLRKELFQTYGTTLRGLQMTRAVNEQEYVAYVHNIPMEQYLSPDSTLHDVLLSYPQKKMIFTNADREHANRVTRTLQIADCFEGTIDIFDIAPYCKPMPEAFEIALRKTGETNPRRCVFVDDSPRNIIAARALGFYTIQVGNPKPGYYHPEADADAHIAQLRDLPLVLDPFTE